MKPRCASYTTPEPTLLTSRGARRRDFGSGGMRPLVSMLTTAGVIFLRTGASDGTPLLGGATGDGSVSAARPAVAAARLNAIAANALIIVGRNSRPIALAALRLTTSSNLVGKPTGRSPGFAPRRMRST